MRNYTRLWGGVRETPRSWERFSVKEKMVDFLLSSVSTEKAQRVDADRGNHFRDRFTPWMMMDQASGRVYMLYDVHALVMSCPHREEQLKLPQSISGSSFDLDCLPAPSRLASVAAPTLQASQVLLSALRCLCSPICRVGLPFTTIES